MEIRPFKTIAESEAKAAKDFPDLSTMPLSKLVARVLQYVPDFAGQPEEAVFIAACGDRENGLSNHKKYRIFPKNGVGVRAFCIARLGRIARELAVAAPAT